MNCVWRDDVSRSSCWGQGETRPASDRRVPFDQRARTYLLSRLQIRLLCFFAGTVRSVLGGPTTTCQCQSRRATTDRAYHVHVVFRSRRATLPGDHLGDRSAVGAVQVTCRPSAAAAPQRRTIGRRYCRFRRTGRTGTGRIVGWRRSGPGRRSSAGRRSAASSRGRCHRCP